MAADPSLGTKIRRARERKRMSQQQLADALEVSRGAVNAWENDRARPASSIGALEDVLGVSLDGDDSEAELVIIPPDLQRRIDRLTPEEQDYVIGRLMRRRGEPGEAPA